MAGFCNGALRALFITFAGSAGLLTQALAEGVTLYQHCNYEGYAVTLPAGDYSLDDLQRAGLVNDDVSSVKVPAGYRAVLFEHARFAGASLELDGDDSCLVGDNFNDRLSSIKVESTVDGKNVDFYVAIAADSQFPWEPQNFASMNMSKEDAARLVNKNQVDSIKAIAGRLGGKLKGVIINGDLTSFGEGWELAEYINLWPAALANTAPLYEGLGNHDYQNNLGNCTPSCPDRMIDYMNSRFGIIGTTSRDPDSLAYSWDIDGVHFIQLHNFPAYTAITARYNIKPSMEWLENDLKQARASGKPIIVNLHDFSDKFITEHGEQYSEFKSLMDKYKVSAVFAGHTHKYFKEISGSFRFNTRYYFVGSPMYNKYLLVHFSRGAMDVDYIDSTDGGTKATNITTLHPLNFSTATHGQYQSRTRGKKAHYSVTVKTGNGSAGGTDSNIYISFTGTEGQSEETLLDTKGLNDFEAGDERTYILRDMLDVGTLKGFKIRSDLSGAGYPWDLKSVSITKGDDTYFQLINRVLEDDTSKSQYFDVTSNLKYIVKIYTGTDSGAGTDSNITLKICGEPDGGGLCTDEIRLNGYISGNAFENGDVDTVVFYDVYTGNGSVRLFDDLSIMIKSDQSYPGAAWQLDKIEVSTDGGGFKSFAIDQWINDTDNHWFN